MKTTQLKVRMTRWAVLAATVVLGGCAVYSTPSGDIIGPAPVVIAPQPAVIISPFGYYGSYGGYSGYSGYGNYRRYPGPRYYPRGGYSGPRYYGRPYNRF